MDTDKELFSIGEISRYCRIPISTLRYYDEIGLIKPEAINEETKYRYYGHETLILLPILKYYKQYGFRLKEIKELIKRDDLHDLSRLFAGKIEDYRERIMELRAMSESLHSWQDLILEAQDTIHDGGGCFQTKHYKSIAVATCRPALFKHKTLKHLLVCNEYGALFPGLITCGPLFIEYPSREKRLAEHYENCLLHIEIHPACKKKPAAFGNFYAVSGHHIGPHETIGETYRAMEAWSREHNFSLADGTVERYVIDDWSTRNSENFVTEIMLPLR